MTFWIAVVLLSALTLFLLAAPIWRKQEEAADRADYDLSVFRDQLKELDRDLERGLINAEEADTARIEIQRRLLAADDKRRNAEEGNNAVSGKTLAISALAGVVLIVGAFALYVKLGTPGYGDMPFAKRDLQKERQMATADKAKGLERELAKLQKHLADSPEDVDGWLLLARTMRSLGKPEEAVKAFAGALKASGGHPSIMVDYAESKIYADKGSVSADSRQLLEDAVKQDPMQLKGYFYLGFAMARDQQFEPAIQTWVDLLAMSPPEAPWTDQVREQIASAAQAGNVDVTKVKPSEGALILAKQIKAEWEKEQAETAQTEAPGPTREQMEEAAELSDEDRSDMIKSMVQRLADKLEENPNDIEGWKRLARAYQVLGDQAKAAEAEAKVRELSQ